MGGREEGLQNWSVASYASIFEGVVWDKSLPGWEACGNLLLVVNKQSCLMQHILCEKGRDGPDS